MIKLISKDQYATLLSQAVEKACDLCEEIHKIILSKNLIFKISIPNYSEDTFNFIDLLDIIYINKDIFYKSIDVFVKNANPELTSIFIAVSGHDPSSFEETWDPQFLGPFKPTVLEKINK